MKFLKSNLVFRTGLNLQKHYKDNTESQAQFPLFLASYIISIAHLLQLMKVY